jgi:DNA polymerase-3 subunit epsilon
MAYRFRHLQLERSLAVLDLESTGVDPESDRIVEVAVLRFEPRCRLTRPLRTLVNPARPIPESASRVHGITDRDVADQPPFELVAPRVRRLLAGCDLAGFNLRRFDLPLLAAEMRRAGQEFSLEGRSIVDAMQVYHRQAPRDLAAAVAHYLGRRHVGAHAACHDAWATALVLDAQLGADPELPRTPAGLHEALVAVDVADMFSLDGGEVVLAAGKHRGRPLRAVAREGPGYLRWLLRRALLDDARGLIERALEDAARE